MSQPKRILVVDDDAPVVELLREVLVDQDYEVDTASTGSQALERIRAEIYDAAIVDFGLPDMDGVTLHHRIRQLDDELAGHTIFISGMSQTEDNLGYFAAYSRGFLSKPFEVREVLAAVRGIFAAD
ncbi:MAG TPA: response regulator [Candidatus Polarisedimenticolaceae bacterium]|nr:response regulator [Candidatus Polarisedimenticolaceae bacterium]